MHLSKDFVAPLLSLLHPLLPDFGQTLPRVDTLQKQHSQVKHCGILNLDLSVSIHAWDTFQYHAVGASQNAAQFVQGLLLSGANVA